MHRKPLEDVVHPSMQGAITRNLRVALSNYEFRGYLNGRGTVVLHHRSLLLISSNSGFSLEGYLRDIFGSLTLPGEGPLAFDELDYSIDLVMPYDGCVLGHRFHAVIHTGWRTIEPRIARMRLQVDLNIHGAPFRGVVEHSAPVLRRFRP